MRRLLIKNSDKFTLVDNDIYEKYKNYQIVLRGNYVYLNINGEHRYLHRLILGLDKYSPLFVDHIDRNPLNNQRNNLRIATNSQNMANTGKIRNGKGYTSKYKGVCKVNKSKDMWACYIYIHGKSYYIGSSDDEETVARMYDKVALQYFGKYAGLNFPNETKKLKNLRVRYVDYDKNIIKMLDENEMLLKAKKSVEKRLAKVERLRQERKESFAEKLHFVKNKKLGKVLKIYMSGKDECDFFYTDRQFYKILSNYRFNIVNNKIIASDEENKETSLYKLLGIRYAKYKHADGNIRNCLLSNIIKDKAEITYAKRYGLVVKNIKNKSSKYIGISKNNDGSSYTATIHRTKESIHLGTCHEEEMCAKIYDAGARRFFGPDAVLNFPDYENPYLKLAIDKDYIKPPKIQINKNKTSKYYGVSKENKVNAYNAGLGSRFRFGRFLDENYAALVVAYGAIISRLYKLDRRWLNYPVEQIKELRKIVKEKVKKEDKEKVKQVLNGVRWA